MKRPVSVQEYQDWQNAKKAMKINYPKDWSEKEKKSGKLWIVALLGIAVGLYVRFFVMADY